MTMTPDQFNALARHFETDKGDKRNCWGLIYAPIIANLVQRQPCRLLQIGIPSPGDLKLWNFLLPQATVVAIDTEQTSLILETEHTVIINGTHNSESFLKAVHTIHGPFDLIIDATDHEDADAKQTWDICYPLLLAGGYYVREKPPHELPTKRDGTPKNFNKPLKQGFKFIGTLDFLITCTRSIESILKTPNAPDARKTEQITLENLLKHD